MSSTTNRQHYLESRDYDVASMHVALAEFLLEDSAAAIQSLAAQLAEQREFQALLKDAEEEEQKERNLITTTRQRRFDINFRLFHALAQDLLKRVAEVYEHLRLAIVVGCGEEMQQDMVRRFLATAPCLQADLKKGVPVLHNDEFRVQEAQSAVSFALADEEDHDDDNGTRKDLRAAISYLFASTRGFPSPTESGAEAEDDDGEVASQQQEAAALHSWSLFCRCCATPEGHALQLQRLQRIHDCLKTYFCAVAKHLPVALLSRTPRLVARCSEIASADNNHDASAGVAAFDVNTVVSFFLLEMKQFIYSGIRCEVTGDAVLSEMLALSAYFEAVALVLQQLQKTKNSPGPEIPPIDSIRHTRGLVLLLAAFFMPKRADSMQRALIGALDLLLGEEGEESAADDDAALYALQLIFYCVSANAATNNISHNACIKVVSTVMQHPTFEVLMARASRNIYSKMTIGATSSAFTPPSLERIQENFACAIRTCFALQLYHELFVVKRSDPKLPRLTTSTAFGGAFNGQVPNTVANAAFFADLERVMRTAAPTNGTAVDQTVLCRRVKDASHFFGEAVNHQQETTASAEKLKSQEAEQQQRQTQTTTPHRVTLSDPGFDASRQYLIPLGENTSMIPLPFCSNVLNPSTGSPRRSTHTDHKCIAMHRTMTKRWTGIAALWENKRAGAYENDSILKDARAFLNSAHDTWFNRPQFRFAFRSVFGDPDSLVCLSEANAKLRAESQHIIERILEKQRAASSTTSLTPEENAELEYRNLILKGLGPDVEVLALQQVYDLFDAWSECSVVLGDQHKQGDDSPQKQQDRAAVAAIPHTFNETQRVDFLALQYVWAAYLLHVPSLTILEPFLRYCVSRYRKQDAATTAPFCGRLNAVEIEAVLKAIPELYALTETVIDGEVKSVPIGVVAKSSKQAPQPPLDVRTRAALAPTKSQATFQLSRREIDILLTLVLTDIRGCYYLISDAYIRSTNLLKLCMMQCQFANVQPSSSSGNSSSTSVALYVTTCLARLGFMGPAHWAFCACERRDQQLQQEQQISEKQKCVAAYPATTPLKPRCSVLFFEQMSNRSVMHLPLRYTVDLAVFPPHHSLEQRQKLAQELRLLQQQANGDEENCTAKKKDTTPSLATNDNTQTQSQNPLSPFYFYCASGPVPKDEAKLFAAAKTIFPTPTPQHNPCANPSGIGHILWLMYDYLASALRFTYANVETQKLWQHATRELLTAVMLHPYAWSSPVVARPLAVVAKVVDAADRDPSTYSRRQTVECLATQMLCDAIGIGVTFPNGADTIREMMHSAAPEFEKDKKLTQVGEAKLYALLQLYHRREYPFFPSGESPSSLILAEPQLDLSRTAPYLRNLPHCHLFPLLAPTTSQHSMFDTIKMYFGELWPPNGTESKLFNGLARLSAKIICSGDFVAPHLHGTLFSCYAHASNGVRTRNAQMVCWAASVQRFSPSDQQTFDKNISDALVLLLQTRIENACQRAGSLLTSRRQGLRDLPSRPIVHHRPLATQVRVIGDTLADTFLPEINFALHAIRKECPRVHDIYLILLPWMSRSGMPFGWCKLQAALLNFILCGCRLLDLMFQSSLPEEKLQQQIDEIVGILQRPDATASFRRELEMRDDFKTEFVRIAHFCQLCESMPFEKICSNVAMSCKTPNYIVINGACKPLHSAGDDELRFMFWLEQFVLQLRKLQGIMTDPKSTLSKKPSYQRPPINSCFLEPQLVFRECESRPLDLQHMLKSTFDKRWIQLYEWVRDFFRCPTSFLHSHDGVPRVQQSLPGFFEAEVDTLVTPMSLFRASKSSPQQQQQLCANSSSSRQLTVSQFYDEFVDLKHQYTMNVVAPSETHLSFLLQHSRKGRFINSTFINASSVATSGRLAVHPITNETAQSAATLLTLLFPLHTSRTATTDEIQPNDFAAQSEICHAVADYARRYRDEMTTGNALAFERILGSASNKHPLLGMPLCHGVFGLNTPAHQICFPLKVRNSRILGSLVENLFVRSDLGSTMLKLKHSETWKTIMGLAHQVGNDMTQERNQDFSVLPWTFDMVLTSAHATSLGELDNRESVWHSIYTPTTRPDPVLRCFDEDLDMSTLTQLVSIGASAREVFSIVKASNSPSPIATRQQQRAWAIETHLNLPRNQPVILKRLTQWTSQFFGALKDAARSKYLSATALGKADEWLKGIQRSLLVIVDLYGNLLNFEQMLSCAESVKDHGGHCLTNALMTPCVAEAFLQRICLQNLLFVGSQHLLARSSSASVTEQSPTGEEPGTAPEKKSAVDEALEGMQQVHSDEYDHYGRTTATVSAANASLCGDDDDGNEDPTATAAVVADSTSGSSSDNNSDDEEAAEAADHHTLTIRQRAFTEARTYDFLLQPVHVHTDFIHLIGSILRKPTEAQAYGTYYYSFSGSHTKTQPGQLKQKFAGLNNRHLLERLLLCYLYRIEAERLESMCHDPVAFSPEYADAVCRGVMKGFLPTQTEIASVVKANRKGKAKKHGEHAILGFERQFYFRKFLVDYVFGISGNNITDLAVFGLTPPEIVDGQIAYAEQMILFLELCLTHDDPHNPKGCILSNHGTIHGVVAECICIPFIHNYSNPEAHMELQERVVTHLARCLRVIYLILKQSIDVAVSKHTLLKKIRTFPGVIVLGQILLHWDSVASKRDSLFTFWTTVSGGRRSIFSLVHNSTNNYAPKSGVTEQSSIALIALSQENGLHSVIARNFRRALLRFEVSGGDASEALCRIAATETFKLSSIAQMSTHKTGKIVAAPTPAACATKQQPADAPPSEGNSSYLVQLLPNSSSGTKRLFEALYASLFASIHRDQLIKGTKNCNGEDPCFAFVRMLTDPRVIVCECLRLGSLVRELSPKALSTHLGPRRTYASLLPRNDWSYNVTSIALRDCYPSYKAMRPYVFELSFAGADPLILDQMEHLCNSGGGRSACPVPPKDKKVHTNQKTAADASVASKNLEWADLMTACSSLCSARGGQAFLEHQLRKARWKRVRTFASSSGDEEMAEVVNVPFEVILPWEVCRRIGMYRDGAIDLHDTRFRFFLA